MKKPLSIIAFALGAAASLGAASVPETHIWPAGNWPLCEGAPQISVCANFVAGSEHYMLTIHATDDQSVAFHYRVTATMPDGTTKVLSGVAQRADSADGTTIVMLPTSGIVKTFGVQVEELVVRRGRE